MRSARADEHAEAATRAGALCGLTAEDVGGFMDPLLVGWSTADRAFCVVCQPTCPEGYRPVYAVMLAARMACGHCRVTLEDLTPTSIAEGRQRQEDGPADDAHLHAYYGGSGTRPIDEQVDTAHAAKKGAT